MGQRHGQFFIYPFEIEVIVKFAFVKWKCDKMNEVREIW